MKTAQAEAFSFIIGPDNPAIWGGYGEPFAVS